MNKLMKYNDHWYWYSVHLPALLKAVDKVVLRQEFKVLVLLLNRFLRGKGAADRKIVLRCDFNNPAQPLMLFPGRAFDPPKSLCSSLGGVQANTLQLKQKHSACYESVFYTLLMFTLLFSRLYYHTVSLFNIPPSPPCFLTSAAFPTLCLVIRS